MAKSKRPIKQTQPRRRQKAAKTGKQGKAAEKAPTPPELPEGLTEATYTFALAYLSNGFNASAAYRSAHPGVTDATSRTEGHRTLANPNVARYLRRRLEADWSAEEMRGEEAVARVSRDARADIRQLFDEKGKLLPPHEWPDTIAGSVKAVEVRQDGGYKVTLVDPGTSRRTMLEVSGRLKGIEAQTVDALVDAIRADRARREGKAAAR